MKTTLRFVALKLRTHDIMNAASRSISVVDARFYTSNLPQSKCVLFPCL